MTYGTKVKDIVITTGGGKGGQPREAERVGQSITTKQGSKIASTDPRSGKSKKGYKVAIGAAAARN